MTLGDDTLLPAAAGPTASSGNARALARPPVTLIGFRPEPWFEALLTAGRPDDRAPCSPAAGKPGRPGWERREGRGSVRPAATYRRTGRRWAQPEHPPARCLRRRA
ncbi:hypothetical protein Ait01nite_032840 [Actinoplanes italicus]|nr:hypothetical protein Ait01nite_032840 [Actinoplanes italicus]